MAPHLLPALRGLSAAPETKTLVLPEQVEQKAILYQGGYSSVVVAGQSRGGIEDRASGYDLGTVVIDGYERVVWVFKSVEFISGHASRLPFRIAKNRNAQDELVIEDHPLYRVLNKQANPLETGRQFRKRLSAQVLLSKRGAFVEVTKSRAGTVTRLDLLPPDRVRPVPSEDGDYLSHFEFTTKRSEVRELDPERVRWIRDPHPTDPFCGVTPLEAAGISIELDHLSRLYNVSFIKNDGRPGGIVGVDTDTLDDPEMDRIERRFAPGATEAGKITVIGTGPGGIKYIDTTTRPRDMAYGEASKNAKGEILAAFGLDESVIGTVSGRTYDNAEQALYNAYTQVLVPHFDLIASAFDQDVDDEFDPFLDTRSIEVLELPRRKIREEARAEVTLGARSINEYRPLAGLEPIDSPYARATWISPSKAPIPARPEDAEALGLAGPGAAEGTVGGGTAADAVALAQAGTATDAVAEARGEVEPTGGAAGVVEEARGLAGVTEPGDAAAVVDAARTETKALSQADPPPVYEPDDSEAQRVELAVSAALDALTARQVNTIAARLEAPKARKGTRYWAADGPEDTRGGEGPLDVPRAVDVERWVQETQDTLAPIVEPAGAEAAAGLYGALAAAGVIAGGTAGATTAGEFATEAAQSAAAVTLAALTAAGEATRRFLTDVMVRLDSEQMVATSVDQLTAALRGFYQDRARTFAEETAEMIGHTVVNGARDAAAASLVPIPPQGSGSPWPVTTGIVRTWVTMRDDRVRPSHREVHGTVLPVGEPFLVGGHVLRWPADPFAPPQESRNCRCRLWYRTARESRFLLPNTD